MSGNLNTGSASQTLTLTGNGSGSLPYLPNIIAGTITGSGAITKTGTSTWSLGDGPAGDTKNVNYLYSGNVNVNAGTLDFISENHGPFLCKSQLTINGASVGVSGNTAIFSIFGAAGTLNSGSAGSTMRLSIDYAGTDPSAGFTGTTSGLLVVSGAGSGNLTFGTLTGGASLQNTGTGTITAIAINNTGSGLGAVIGNPFATIKLTGNSGQVNGISDSTIQGLLDIAPSGTGAAVTVTGQDTVVTGAANAARFIYGGGATLKLDKGLNTSVNYQIGSASSNSSSTQAILTRGSAGTLILDPVTGASTLGTTSKFTILQGSGQGNVLPTLTNGLVSTSVVVADNDGTSKADFVTYNGTGVVGDVGFQQATYNLTDSFAGSNATSVVKIAAAPQTISGNTAAFALRNDSTITINGGKTLTLGNATTAPTGTGLILNGGTIAGPGTLALGATILNAYTSTAGGTISANMTGGGSPSGLPCYVSLDKFGLGTLSLTGNNSGLTGQIVISQGALDVGTISSAGLAGFTSSIGFNGGVLQGNGTLTRSISTGATDYTSKLDWNMLSNYASGGFAARGGNLTVAIGGTSSPTALTWGLSSGDFITENAVSGQTGMLIFGSNTSDSKVDFQNAMNLGTTVGSLNYYRIIMVNQGTGTDSAQISGVISSTAVHGLIKDGAGKLILTATNTYSGDTVVANGTLIINGNQSAATGATTVNSGATLSGRRT